MLARVPENALVSFGLAVASVACGGAEPPRVTPDGRPPAVFALAEVGPGAPAAPPAAVVPPAASDLRASQRFAAQRTLEARVHFLVAGERGRLAVLADEGGVVVPHRFEDGAWQRLTIPPRWQVTTGQSSLGVYFGRDNRPRLMGHRTDGGGPRLVYLRHRDGAWQDQRSEVGALATDDAILHGVLGEEDPEVVCKVGNICLLKSRRGWTEVKNTVPPTAVVRIFAGVAYALTGEGVLVARGAAFERLGPAAPWTSEATGFAVAADGTITVVEPGADAVHTLPGGTAGWRTEPSPVKGPRDVAGAAGDRWIAGEGGLAHEEDGAFARVGDGSWSFVRVLLAGSGVVAGGASGVVRVSRTP